MKFYSPVSIWKSYNEDVLNIAFLQCYIVDISIYYDKAKDFFGVTLLNKLYFSPDSHPVVRRRTKGPASLVACW